MDVAGYDYVLVDEEIKELICPICFLLIRDAQELGCGHSLCSSCLQKWEGKVQEKSQLKFQCPQCNKLINKKKVKTNHTINRIITSSIKVKCIHHEDGCQWTDVISNIQDHLEKSCEYVPIQCLFDGCRKLIPKVDVEKHSKDCDYRFIKCQHCSLDIVQLDFAKHMGECDEIDVECPNISCNKIMKRKQLNQHFDVCPYQVVACPFQDAGCIAMVIRKSLTEHLQINVHYHLTLVLGEMRALKEEHKKEVVILHDKIDCVTRELDSVRAEFAEYHQVNEIERTVRIKTNRMFSEMKILRVRIQEEQQCVQMSIQDEIKTFDRSFALLEGKLEELNFNLKEIVRKSVETFNVQVTSFNRDNFDILFGECLDDLSLSNDVEGKKLSEEMKEKLHLPSYLQEHKELLGKLHFELANMHQFPEQFQYKERYRVLLNTIEENKKTKFNEKQFLIKLKIVDYFRDEWHIIILRKRSVFSEFNAEKQEDILINKTMNTISIFLGGGLFVHDVPSVSVCSPRKLYKLRLPTLPKDDAKFRVNFTTLMKSDFLVDECILLQITEVPKLFMDSSYFSFSQNK